MNIEVDKIKTSIPKRDWKYYHLESIENFIYHLKTLDGERTKERMAAEIEMYIQLVPQKIKEESPINDKSRDLFPLVWKMSDTYKYEAGFIQKPSYLIISILVIGLFVLLFWLSSLSMAIITCISVLIAYFIYCYYNMKTRKFF